MSACQSHASSGSSCSSSAQPMPPVERPFIPEGTDPINISASVIEKVATMLAEENDPSLQLRIFVTGGGCSGFQYGFAFDDEKKEDDVTVTRDNVKVVVDAMSLQYLMGAEIDYEDNLEGARFVIRNPNASSTCGCGSSFSV